MITTTVTYTVHHDRIGGKRQSFDMQTEAEEFLASLREQYGKYSQRDKGGYITRDTLTVERI